MACIPLYIVLFLFIKLSSADDCVINNIGKNASWELQLIKHLRCNYNSRYPPNTNESFVEVNAKFMMKYFNFDATEELFSIHTWLILYWVDDRLKWTPENYGGLEKIDIYNHNIWYPALRLMNGDAEFDYKDVYMVPCTIEHTGDVTCLQIIYDNTVCSTKLWDWPYDSQVCKLEVGVWKYPMKKINIIFAKKAVNMLVAGYGGEWDITDYKQEEDQGSNTQLRIFFTLERHGEILAAITIYPAVIFGVLTLTSLMIDVRRNLRLGLICFSLANQLLQLNVLAELIPKHSAAHPSLVLYYRGSIILTILVVLLSIILKSLCRKDKMPSALIERVSDYVVNSRLKYIIWKWEYEEEKCKVWMDFASLINSVVLYVFTITYICMYAVYVPQPIPFN
ncbi:hypothetical protein K1T71_013390 [Dendrolimus kikuchii]|uniref:Uncharacterized protein n=1 Tax=Dendrolimus kikuchii TaxID=765133 RepID=A0ACC1CHZ1_9NEOP|nr:hypothetical protein K1T71_013390 [Dendrolimus kikuchii]